MFYNNPDKMRQTYRSKKDVGGGLDRRDVLLNLDEKSSVFDAFYMQNIKQAKKELSCMGSSNSHGVASNKVRKRKYVKRIIKEVEPTPRESPSVSAYLTPDKSIHVNKPLDLFDHLLMSSPAGPVQQQQSKTDNLFDKFLPKKAGKTYCRKKPLRNKKLNYSSSDSTDSDKENTKTDHSTTKNSSDIKSHHLLIENEPQFTPQSDKSINKMVKNLSLYKDIKYNSSCASIKKVLFHQNRLTINLQSPIVQNSPLSSTPFTNKLRTKSIYRFSPIARPDLEESPKYVTITEDNDGDHSIVLQPKFFAKFTPKYLETDSIQTPLTHVPDKTNKHEGSSNSLFSSADLDPIPSLVQIAGDKLKEMPLVEVPSTYTIPVDTCKLNTPVDVNIQCKINIDITTNKRETEIEKSSEIMTSVDVTCDSKVLSNHLSSLQTSEIEPLVGFVDSAIVADNEILAEKDASLILCSGKHSKSSKEGIFYINDHFTESDCSAKENTINDIFAQNISSEVTFPSQPFLGFAEVEIENVECDVDNHNLTNVDCVDLNTSGTSDDCSSQSSDKEDESMYNTCNSEQSTDNENSVSFKEPVVVVEKMNHSLFEKYYRRFPHFSSQDEPCDENIKIDHEEALCDDFTSFENCSISENADESLNKASSFNINKDVISVEEDEHEYSTDEGKDLTNLSGDITNKVDLNLSNVEEDRCVSFVTTRRRNELSNNFTIIVLDDSFISSTGTECDNTVISNNKIDLGDKSENNMTITNFETEDDKSENNMTITNFETEDDKTENNISITNFETENNKSENNMTIKNYDAEVKDEILSTKISPVKIDTTDDNILCDKTYDDTRMSLVSARKSTITPREGSLLMPTCQESSRLSWSEIQPGIVLKPGKKWERSLSIYKRMTMNDHSILDEEDLHTKGRKYRQSVLNTMEMQELSGSLHNESIISRRSTIVSKPSRSTIRIIKEPNNSRVSLCSTTEFDDSRGFHEDCDDTVIELSRLSISDDKVSILEKFHDSSRVAPARDYVLRRCNQTDVILFDECYPDPVLKNCRKIGEGVYGEVYLWRATDGLVRVMKIVPIAGDTKVNGEHQKDFKEIISEIVIAMELSALRAPIAEIECHFDEGKDIDELDVHAVQNATDVFNEVLAVRCVYGTYPCRLLDLWELYDETKGSENDTPAILPPDQQYIVLELANAGQDLESYQFNSAEQAYALFLQVAYGLAVGEEAFQFEHRDLHWGNVLIAPTDQKFATFVLRGRVHRVARRGVAATIIDYSLSRLSLARGAGARARDHTYYNDLAEDEGLFGALGDYQFEVYRLMRGKLGNAWKTFEPFTNILWLHYTVDKMITALRYKRTNTKTHKQYIAKLKGIKNRILNYGSAALFVLTDNEI